MLHEVKEDYYDVVKKLCLYPSIGNLRFYMNTLFRDVDFLNKSVLEIGGGNGLISFYAASMGAKSVICLEPEEDGSSTGFNDSFMVINKELDYSDRVILCTKTFQNYNDTNNKFDIIILHNSINHLDEIACEELHTNINSKYIYLGLFEKLFNLSTPQSKLIIADCARQNIFNMLGIKNPFMSTIEWSKHQQPEIWCELLNMSGFINFNIIWTSFNSFRSIGRYILGNRYASLFLSSHFIITAESSKTISQI